MGGGIAHQSAARGIPVVMKDIAEAGLEQGMTEAAGLLSRQVERGRLSAADMGQALARIRPTLDYSGFEHCDAVIEAVVGKQAVEEAVVTAGESRDGAGTVLRPNSQTV